MKVVVQRVSNAKVVIPSENYFSEIGKGLLILLGIKTDDKIEDAEFLAMKCINLRIFEDENEKVNLSLKDIQGSALVISQFTLYGNAQKGNRPSFIDAARPETAIPLYESFLKKMKEEIGEERVRCGIFGAMMDVHLCNSGPVTITIESK